MDASDGAENSRGEIPPQPGSLPSAVAAPVQGAPVIAPPSVGVVPTEAPAEEAKRDGKGRFKKGKSGNPTGRPPGIPNRNTELLREMKKFKLEGKSYERLLLEISLVRAKAGDASIAQDIMRRAYVNLTPEAAGLTVNVSSNASAQAGAKAETPKVHDRLEELRDPAIRDAFCDLADRLAARRGNAGALGHERN